MSAVVWLVLFVGIGSSSVGAADDVVSFEPELWDLQGAEVTEHLGRTALSGLAILQGVAIQDGVVEVDIAVSGARSYPGIAFRMQTRSTYERFYVRPHRESLYPDALQYTPVKNGVAPWQLYHGDGITAGASIPSDQWIHIRLEFAGHQARVFIDDVDKPALVITDLKHGVSEGGIGLIGPRDGSAYFSNFRYREANDLEFDPVPAPESPPGTLTDWELSQKFKFAEIDHERSPYEQELGEIEWTPITSQSSGLVDVSDFLRRSGGGPDCLLARTTLVADAEETREIQFGYSDAVSVFLNGRLVFFGDSQYRSRDRSFLGVVGLHDAVYLPLEEGENELLLIVVESFGGWGFMCREGDVVYRNHRLTETFDTFDEFVTPESVIYDSKRDMLYVSNFDVYRRRAPDGGGQFVSRLTTLGRIEELKWVTGLSQPTGMAIMGDTLFVVERGNLVKVDIETSLVSERIPVPNSVFLNDIAIGVDGRVYLSDTQGHTIFRSTGDAFEAWVVGGEIEMPNGLRIDGDRLLVGNDGDSCLKAIDIATGAVTTIARLNPGIIDGIHVDPNGGYIVSQWEGKLYRISPDGDIVKLLDTSALKVYAADFEYIPERSLLLVPTFYDDRVVAYRLSD